MSTVDQYLSLITSEHSDKEKFLAAVTTSIEALVGAQNSLLGLPAMYDIDVATGVLLDTVGIWVGRSRRVDTPLTGVYFAWDSGSTDGWDSGVWKNQYDPDSGLVELPDDAYRLLLKAKIAANSWDGSTPGAYRVWSTIFTNSHLVIQDNQDMSMTVGVAGQSLSSVERALLTQGYIPIKPQGVRVAYYAIAPGEGQLFGWDVTPGGALSGWDSGQWPQELLPA